jgi:hypothetical protein
MRWHMGWPISADGFDHGRSRHLQRGKLRGATCNGNWISGCFLPVISGRRSPCWVVVVQVIGSRQVASQPASKQKLACNSLHSEQIKRESYRLDKLAAGPEQAANQMRRGLRAMSTSYAGRAPLLKQAPPRPPARASLRGSPIPFTYTSDLSVLFASSTL